MKYIVIAVLALALVYPAAQLEDYIVKLESRVTQLEKPDPRVKELEFRVDELESLLRGLTRQPDTYKPKDAPPLRYVPAGPGHRTLQYWTEKDGWQFIPKQTHP